MKLHHVGYIVESIDEFLKSLPYNSLLQDTEDKIQDARLCLVNTGSDVFLEIIEPLSINSRLYPQIDRSLGGINHVCYEATLEEIALAIESHNLLKIFGPVPASLFDGRQVEFYVNKNMSIIEFLHE